MTRTSNNFSSTNLQLLIRNRMYSVVMPCLFSLTTNYKFHKEHYKLDDMLMWYTTIWKSTLNQVPHLHDILTKWYFLILRSIFNLSNSPVRFEWLFSPATDTFLQKSISGTWDKQTVIHLRYVIISRLHALQKLYDGHDPYLFAKEGLPNTHIRRTSLLFAVPALGTLGLDSKGCLTFLITSRCFLQGAPQIEAIAPTRRFFFCTRQTPPINP